MLRMCHLCVSRQGVRDEIWRVFRSGCSSSGFVPPPCPLVQQIKRNLGVTPFSIT